MRTLSTIAVAALVLAGTFTAVSGQQLTGRGPGGPGGRGRGFGPGPGGPLPFLSQVNLTDAQRDQIKTLTAEHREDASDQSQSPMRKVGELQRGLQAALFADSPDTAQIDQLRASIAEAEAAALANRIELELKIAQVLTPEQRKQVRDLIASGPPQRVGRRGH